MVVIMFKFLNLIMIFKCFKISQTENLNLITLTMWLLCFLTCHRLPRADHMDHTMASPLWTRTVPALLYLAIPTPTPTILTTPTVDSNVLNRYFGIATSNIKFGFIRLRNGGFFDVAKFKSMGRYGHGQRNFHFQLGIGTWPRAALYCNANW